MLKRRMLFVTAASTGFLLLFAAVVGWAVRLRVASGLIDRRLASTGAPASYRLTRLGPTGARIEQLRLGDPAHPDLSAGRIDVRFGYGWHGPFVAGVSVSGARLGARLDAQGLHLGSLDRLLPRGGGGGAMLPNLFVHLSDVGMTLSTPNGTLALSIDGQGNPQRRFTGRARLEASQLRLGNCRLKEVNAALRVGARSGVPILQGPIGIAATHCPELDLAQGHLQARIETDPTFKRLTADARVGGFDGTAGPARFADLSGMIHVGGRFGQLDGTAQVRLARVAVPSWSRRVAALAGPLAATPLDAVAARAATAVSRLLNKATVEASVSGRLQGTMATVAVRQVQLAGPDGSRIQILSRGGLGWGPQGWRIDADLTSGGGSLPAIRGLVRQPAPGSPISGTLQASPYVAGPSLLTIAPTRWRWSSGHLDFAGAASLDGPLTQGFVQGLTVPLDGELWSDGRFRLGRGCRQLRIEALRIGSLRLGETALPVCGSPIVARRADGRLRVDARTGPVHLAGTVGGNAASLAMADLHLSTDGLVADRVAVTFGGEPSPTRLSIEHLDGGWRGGVFAGAGGTIGAVPIRLAQAGGRWALTGGALHLAGQLRISDTAPSPRFLPVLAQGADLTVADGGITAAATLAEPASEVPIAHMTLQHDLGRGTGEAVLVVDALRFRPKGLQPEALTPLTLGVVANVAGTVTGEGVVDWGPAGTTSHGRFGTDGLDLAAAFGPVTGLSGQIHFTDLLGLVSAPDQEVRVAEINPGVAITDGRVRFHLPGENRVAVDGALWPFAGGTLRLEPTVLDLGEGAERRLTFTLTGLDAAKFVQQLDFPNIAATGLFDGTLPMRFDNSGGRIVGGAIVARPPGGTLAYVGELSSARLGTMGKLAFDALKAIRYSTMAIHLDGRLDGEMVSLVSFAGVRQATPEQGLAARLIRNLPFRFNIRVQAPFRGLVGAARGYADPRLLLSPPPPVQPAASGAVP